MAASRSMRSPRSFARSPRRKTAWEVGPETAGLGGPQELIVSSSNLAGTSTVFLFDGDTHVRLRGELLLFLKLATAAGDGFHGAFGVGIATTPAIVAGIASLPTPLDEEAWDGWLYHRYFSLFAGGTIAAATAQQQADGVNATTAALRLEVDSKAMRKTAVDMGMFAIIQVVEHGGSTMEWSFNCRTLIKLP